MSRAGATPKTAPVGWAFLGRQPEDGFTIRWRQGNRLAYVLDGQRIGDHAAVAGVLATETIPVARRWAGLISRRSGCSSSGGCGSGEQ